MPHAHDAEPEQRAEAAAAGDDQCDERPHQPAHARGRVEQADGPLAKPEQLQSDQHDEDGQCPVDDELRREQADHQAQARIGGDRADPRQRLRQKALRRFLSASLLRLRQLLDPRQQHGRAGEQQPCGGERELDASHGQQQPSERRPDEDAAALEAAGRDVRGGQLIGLLHERRQDRVLGRLESGAHHRHQRAQGHDRGDREVERHGEGDHPGQHGPEDVGGEQHEPSRVAVGQHRRERRRHQRRQQPQRAGHAH